MIFSDAGFLGILRVKRDVLWVTLWQIPSACVDRSKTMAAIQWGFFALCGKSANFKTFLSLFKGFQLKFYRDVLWVTLSDTFRSAKNHAFQWLGYFCLILINYQFFFSESIKGFQWNFTGIFRWWLSLKFLQFMLICQKHGHQCVSYISHYCGLEKSIAHVWSANFNRSRVGCYWQEFCLVAFVEAVNVVSQIAFTSCCPRYFYQSLFSYVNVVLGPQFLSIFHYRIKFHQKWLTLTALWANSADDKLTIFFLIFLENNVWHFMQIVFK